MNVANFGIRHSRCIIDKWKVPNWHKDWGNPENELDLLKEYCTQIFKINQSFKFELDCFEEGYMCVKIYVHKKLLGEIYAVKSEIHEIGLFLENGEEVYFSNLKELDSHFLN